MAEEIKKEKQVLENQIASLIETFEEKTETSITDIEIIRNAYRSLDELIIKNTKVNIKVEI